MEEKSIRIRCDFKIKGVFEHRIKGEKHANTKDGAKGRCKT